MRLSCFASITKVDSFVTNSTMPVSIELRVAPGGLGNNDAEILNDLWYGLLVHASRRQGLALVEDVRFIDLAAESVCRIVGVQKDEARFFLDRGTGSELDLSLVRLSAFVVDANSSTSLGESALQQAYVIAKPKQGQIGLRLGLCLHLNAGGVPQAFMASKDGIVPRKIWGSDEWTEAATIIADIPFENDMEQYCRSLAQAFQDHEKQRSEARLAATAATTMPALAHARSPTSAEVALTESPAWGADDIATVIGSVTADTQAVRIDKRDDAAVPSTRAPAARWGTKEFAVVSLASVAAIFALTQFSAPRSMQPEPPVAPPVQTPGPPNGGVGTSRGEPPAPVKSPAQRGEVVREIAQVPPPSPPAASIPTPTPTTTPVPIAKASVGDSTPLTDADFASVLMPTGNYRVPVEELYSFGFDDHLSAVNKALKAARRGDYADFDQQMLWLRSNRPSRDWPPGDAVARRKFSEFMEMAINRSKRNNDANGLRKSAELSERFLMTHFGHSTSHLNLSIARAAQGNGKAALAPAFHTIVFNPDGANGYVVLGVGLARSADEAGATNAFCSALRKTKYSEKTVAYFATVAAGADLNYPEVTRAMKETDNVCPRSRWDSNYPGN